MATFVAWTGVEDVWAGATRDVVEHVATSEGEKGVVDGVFGVVEFAGYESFVDGFVVGKQTGVGAE